MQDVHPTYYTAADSFPSVCGFDFEEHCVNLFFCFDKFTKRKSTLKEYYKLCDSQYADFIKCSSTCSLSLECYLNKKLNKFPAVTSFSLSGEKGCKNK